MNTGIKITDGKSGNYWAKMRETHPYEVHKTHYPLANERGGFGWNNREGRIMERRLFETFSDALKWVKSNSEKDKAKDELGNEYNVYASTGWGRFWVKSDDPANFAIETDWASEEEFATAAETYGYSVEELKKILAVA